MPSESSGFERTDREILIGMRKDIRYMRDELEKQAKDAREVYKDHEGRIRVLEHFRWWIFGSIIGSAGLSAVASRLLSR